MADTPPAGHDPGEPGEVSVASLRDLAHQHAGDIRDPEGWARCLRLAARMPGEKLWANILLIDAQRPGATLVRDHEGWQPARRRVRHERGIKIFSTAPAAAPDPQSAVPATEARRDDPVPDWRQAGRTATVWDLAQTTGPPVTVTEPEPGQPAPDAWDALCWLARREGYAVEREYGCPDDGSTMWSARRIRISPGTTGHAAVWALAHQIGHILLHSNPDPAPADPARAGAGPPGYDRDMPAYPPGATTSGCTGIVKAEADSLAYILCCRHDSAALRPPPHPHSWAGRDPRADPGRIILAAGQRIITAAGPALDYLGRTLPATQILLGAGPVKAPPPARTAPRLAAPAPENRAQQQPPGTQAAIGNVRVLAAARSFYLSQYDTAWVPGYLHARGIDDTAARAWGIGYAPGGWTALTGHLRARGHSDEEIQAAGLARRSRRGTLIDFFRDRVVFPVHDEHGAVAGFTCRAPDGAPKNVPKYLNSPETASYRKNELLFGLHQGARQLSAGAVPVIAEGPFDAIAISLADPGRFVGLAPCGTALTTRQAELLSTAADLRATGIVVAFDADEAGRKAAIRAYGILRPFADLQTVRFNGKDPAETLQAGGPQAVRAVLRGRRHPLSAVLIDARISEWERRLQDADGPYMAMLSTATLIAGLLPGDSAALVRQIAGGRELRTADDMLRPLPVPEIAKIAGILPADTSYQITRAATALRFDASEVLAEVANAVTRNAATPLQRQRARHEARPARRPSPMPPAQLAGSSFPKPPLAGAPCQEGRRYRAPTPPARPRRTGRAP